MTGHEVGPNMTPYYYSRCLCGFTRRDVRLMHQQMIVCLVRAQLSLYTIWDGMTAKILTANHHDT